MARGKRNDKIAICLNGTVIRSKQAAVRRARKGLDGPFDFVGIPDRSRYNLDPERWRDGLGSAQKIAIREPLWVAEQRDPCQRRRNLLEHTEPFAEDAVLVKQNAAGVAARPAPSWRLRQHRWDRTLRQISAELCGFPAAAP